MKCLVTLIVAAALTTSPVSADIARGDDDPPEITDIYSDLDEWLAAAPEVTVIDFTEYVGSGQIDDEYAHLGVNFTLGFYTLHDGAGCLDGWCLDGNATTIVMEFDQPFNVIGVMFPGILRYELYLDDELVGWTENVPISGSSGQFAGLLTEISFDEVRVVRDSGQVFVDNLYFSFLEVPAPGAVALLGIAALAGCTRRRRRQA